MAKTIEEATREWVKGFNCIPTNMIADLWREYPDDWAEITPELHIDGDEQAYSDFLPMSNAMYSFDDYADIRWLDTEQGLIAMAECGFRIYESENYGRFFGIDGAGYDFMDAHWIPLYKVRGLHWHTTDTEE